MSLFISYVPDDPSGEPLMVDLVSTESYDDIVNAACESWKNILPSKEQIVGRRLAHFVQLPCGRQTWAIIQPERLPQIVRNTPDGELELRLQIVRAQPPDDLHQLSNALSAMGIPFANSPLGMDTGINPGSHPTTEPHSVPSEDPTRTPVIRPVSPSLFLGTSPPPNHDSSNSSTRPSCEPKETTPAVLFDKGLNEFLTGRYSEARTQFQLAANQYHKQADSLREADSLCQLGVACRELRDYGSAREHLLNARSMYRSLGDDTLQERRQCDRHLARVKEDRGDTEAALSAYQDLIHKTEREQLELEYMWCCYYLGRLYSRTARYEEARSLLRDVHRASRKIQSFEIEGLATEDLGYTAEREGLPQLAMDCYERALEIFKDAGNGKWTGHESRVV
ncbi:TPR-like protein [Ceratobasidium sp. AG-I]|nr:TPR-like protein [Ceratobasidium sp. AG-I]